MGAKFKVEGFKELDKALGEMTKATARNVLKRALVKAGQPILDEARRLVPVDTGALKGGLAISAKVTASAFKAAFARIKSSGGSTAEAAAAGRTAQRGSKSSFAEVILGPGRHPQASLQEFGTVTNPAQPFMRPAWDANKGKALKIFKSELAVQIGKAAKRAAARAAKLKAKGG